MEILKVWWMLSWRLGIFSAIWVVNVTNGSPSSAMVGAIGLSIVPAVVLVAALRKSVYTFPIIRLIMRKPVLIQLGTGQQPPARANPLIETHDE